MDEESVLTSSCSTISTTTTTTTNADVAAAAIATTIHVTLLLFPISYWQKISIYLTYTFPKSVQQARPFT